jgi:hypothetical protein
VSATAFVDPGPTAANGSVTIGSGKTEDLSTLVNGLITPGLPGDTETLTSVSAVTGNAVLGANNDVTYTAPGIGPDTITYTVEDEYDSTATGQVAVTVQGNVFREATGSVSAPPSPLIVHVGDGGGTYSQALIVNNAAANDGFSEYLIGSVNNANNTSNGTIVFTTNGSPTPDIAPGQDSTAIAASFSTATAGTVSGTATVDFQSDGTPVNDGSGPTSVGSQVVNINATVDNYAVAALQEENGGAATFSGNAQTGYTLNFGTVALNGGGGKLSAVIDALNAALGPADVLNWHGRHAQRVRRHPQCIGNAAGPVHGQCICPRHRFRWPRHDDHLSAPTHLGLKPNDAEFRREQKMIKSRCMVAVAAAAGLFFVSGGGVRADLVTNGNFGTGDFTGWTLTPPGTASGIDIDSSNPNTGDTYDALFSFPTTGTLSQNIATTPGSAYNLSFAVLDDGGFFLDSFLVTFGGLTTTITGDQAFPGPPYAVQSFLIPGADITAATTTLSFQLTGSSNDWHLDDVSITPATVGVPGPVMGGGLPGLIFVISGLLLWTYLDRRRMPSC